MNKFTFDIDPCPAPRMTSSDRWKKRPVVTKYFGFCNHIRSLANVKGLGMLPGTIDSLIFNIAMPASWSKKKRAEMEGTAHQQTPDLDNLVKGFLDALCVDDKHIHSIGQLNKVWASEGSIKLSCEKPQKVLSDCNTNGLFGNDFQTNSTAHCK